MVGKLLLKYVARPLLIECAAKVGEALGDRLARKIDPEGYAIEVVEEDESPAAPSA